MYFFKQSRLAAACRQVASERLCARRGAGPRHAAASALSGSSASLRLRSVHPLKTFKGFDKNKKIGETNIYIFLKTSFLFIFPFWASKFVIFDLKIVFCIAKSSPGTGSEVIWPDSDPENGEIYF